MEVSCHATRLMRALLPAVLAALLFAACAPKNPDHPKFIVAEVNKTKITRAQLDGEMARLVKRIGIAPDQLTADQKSSLEWYAVNDLVDKQIVTSSLSPEQASEISLQLDQRLEGIKKQFGTKEAYDKALETEGMSEAEIRADMGHEAGMAKLLETNNPGVLQATPEEISEFYKNNSQLWKAPEQVRARHILIRTEPTASIEQIAEAKKAAEAALARVTKGEDFAKVAAEVSQDPGSKDRGGELPPFGKGQMVPAFEQVAFSTPVGKTSKVFKSDFGFHFLQVQDKRAARTVPFEEVSQRIGQAVVSQKRSEASRKLMTELKDKAAAKINIAEPARPPAGAGGPGMGGQPGQPPQ